MKVADEYETCLREKLNYRPPPSPAQALVPETAFQSKGRTQQLKESFQAYAVSRTAHPRTETRDKLETAQTRPSDSGHRKVSFNEPSTDQRATTHMQTCDDQNNPSKPNSIRGLAIGKRSEDFGSWGSPESKPKSKLTTPKE
ncbi:hypothetical protein J6590_072791 [Homalodisca vitripennis]|nr:hypothetical protein J6590_096679 [Homalodisca vitripennis]KAG8295789.1 hypothetical protein J6590_072791 [Homalodisca vitripennis]